MGSSPSRNLLPFFFCHAPSFSDLGASRCFLPTVFMYRVETHEYENHEKMILRTRKPIASYLRKFLSSKYHFEGKYYSKPVRKSFFYGRGEFGNLLRIHCYHTHVVILLYELTRCTIAVRLRTYFWKFLSSNYHFGRIFKVTLAANPFSIRSWVCLVANT